MADKQPALSPELQAKLERLRELETVNAQLEGEKERLAQQLVERGMQPNQFGIKAVQRVETRAIKKTVKQMVVESKVVAVPDERGQLVAANKVTEVEKDVEIEVDEDVAVERYILRIDLPPSGGIALRRNGVPYFHGQEYEFGFAEMCDVREQIQRSWAHEASIKGSDENAYRPQLNVKINGRRQFTGGR